jgi:type IV secretory pathway TrbD component
LLVFFYFYTAADRWVLHLASGSALLTTLVFASWLVLRARRTLGKPHPGWRWYLAAIIFLSLSLLLVPVMALWPGAYHELRLLHLHLNTLGFVGVTAIGTLQVLLPTVLSGPDAGAAARLRHDLPMAAGGVLAVGFGSAYWMPLSIFGAALLLLVGLRLGISWWRRYGVRKIASDGASAALAAALCGFLLLILLGVAHALHVVDTRQAVPAFVVAFLLPLVSGALSQLLPVWQYPGRRTLACEHMRRVLVAGGASRSLLFITGGIALALGVSDGVWLAAAGILSFLFAIVRAYFSEAKC